MKEKIQLNHVVSPQNYRLLKDGIRYYTWVRSRRRNRHYLLPLKEGEKTARQVGGVVFFLVISILCYFWFFRGQGGWGLMLFGCVADGLSGLLLFRYCRRAAGIIDLLPRFPIAVADLDRGFLKIRNRSGLPFVQTREDSWRIECAALRYVKENSAYKIYNGKEKLWRYFGKAPTWFALSVGYEESPGQCDTQLLFVGSRIPENVFEFFETTLGLELQQHEDYSRFDT